MVYKYEGVVVLRRSSCGIHGMTTCYDVCFAYYDAPAYSEIWLECEEDNMTNHHYMAEWLNDTGWRIPPYSEGRDENCAYLYGPTTTTQTTTTTEPETTTTEDNEKTTKKGT